MRWHHFRTRTKRTFYHITPKHYIIDHSLCNWTSGYNHFRTFWTDLDFSFLLTLRLIPIFWTHILKQVCFNRVRIKTNVIPFDSPWESARWRDRTTGSMGWVTKVSLQCLDLCLDFRVLILCHCSLQNCQYKKNSVFLKNCIKLDYQ